jgi:hypothetical protein
MGTMAGQGLLGVSVRVFLLLMVVNSLIKYTIFSWLYLLVAAYFWLKPLSPRTIVNLSSAAICFLGLQYLCLLLNITPVTSPLPIPPALLQIRAMSLVGIWISDQQIL